MKKLDLYIYPHEVDIKSNYNSRYVLFSLVIPRET